jgi:hypothetical protein
MKNTPRPLDDSLLASYHSTCYRVRAPGVELQLRIGQYDAHLAKVLREAWVASAVLLTAWNPGSRQQTRQQNDASQEALLQELKAAGYPCLAGTNEAENTAESGTNWHETSVLALDVPLASAREIAARYGQLAFLWIDQQATPRLEITATPSA